jgi:hypothetical protein
MAFDSWSTAGELFIHVLVMAIESTRIHVSTMNDVNWVFMPRRGSRLV